MKPKSSFASASNSNGSTSTSGSKEKLRPTLSEPEPYSSALGDRKVKRNNSEIRTGLSGIGDPETSASASPSSTRGERRARWIRNKIGFSNIYSSGTGSNTMREENDPEVYEEGEPDDEDASPSAHARTQVHIADESTAGSPKLRRHSKHDPITLKNRWKQKQRTATFAPSTLQPTSTPLSRISDENETSMDEDRNQRQGQREQVTQRRVSDVYGSPASPRHMLQKEPTLTRQNGIRYSLRNRRSHSPSPQCSISSESEVSQKELLRGTHKKSSSSLYHCDDHDGDCTSHDRSAMISTPEHIQDESGRRKQSVFFASYGVWSAESVQKSFRELSPDVTSILEAAWSGQVTALEELLEKPEQFKNIECRDGKGRTALHLAAAGGHAGVIELLLNKGAQVDPLDTIEKATPLMCAAAAGSLASISILIDHGANVNSGYEVGKTPLHWAVQASCLECAKLLLEKGAKQNPPLVYQETSLHLAASLGDAEILLLLLTHGADMSLCRGSNRYTALHIAAEEGNATCCRVLLKAGASHEAKDARGHTPLHVAASVDAECTSVLLEAGANPNAMDRDGRTPLHCAISRGSRAAECVRLLVEHQAEINCQDNFGYTPLHLAAVNESSQVSSILLRHGADVTMKTKAGVTALSLLVRRIPDVMRFLVDRLDSAVNIHDHEPADPDCEVRLDFRAVVPNTEKRSKKGGKMPERAYYHTPRKETEFLTCVLAAGYKKILSHPLSEAFLALKWQRVRKFFWASLLFQVALVLLFTVYVVNVYLIKCPARRPEAEGKDDFYHYNPGPAGPGDIQHEIPSVPPDSPAFIVPSTNQTDIPIIIPKPPENPPKSTTPNKTIAGFRAKRDADFNPFSFSPPRRRKNRTRQHQEEGEYRSRGGGGDRSTRKPFHVGYRDGASVPSEKEVSHDSAFAINSNIDTNTSEDEVIEFEKGLAEEDKCHMETWLTVIWCLLITFTLLMGVKETFQFLQAPFSYVKSSENWGQWALIGSVLSAAWPANIPNLDLHSWQYPAAAFGMFLAWGLMLLQVGRFPALGLYVQMLGKVAANFGLVIMAYACLLIAFALAFCVIFPGEPPYYSVPLAILKVLTMMVGEVDYEEFFYDEDHPLLYPITAHILHGAFVIVITVILMNLLVGLAVSDIQGLQKGAKLNRLSRQTALISRLESFIFSKRLQACLPKSVGLILQRSALLVPSSYNWSYYFRPNDPRDKRLPKELKQSALRLAATRHGAKHSKTVSSDSSPKPHLMHCHQDSIHSSTDHSSVRRLEQKIDNLELQVDSILQSLSGQMDLIRSMLEEQKQASIPEPNPTVVT